MKNNIDRYSLDIDPYDNAGKKRKPRKAGTLPEFKHLGHREDEIKKRWMLDEKTLVRRAFETVFGNGKLDRRVDKKRIPPLHLQILVSKGYAKNLPNIGCCILTDKAFEDRNSILCKKN